MSETKKTEVKKTSITLKKNWGVKKKGDKVEVLSSIVKTLKEKGIA